MGNDVITIAEQYRLQGDLESAFKLVSPLVDNEINNALVQFEMALIYDAMSQDDEAIPLYEKALSIGVPQEKRCELILCLGSSYRNVGKVDSAKRILKTAIEEFPNHIGLRCFYALALNSAGEKGLAARILMDAILNIQPESVKPYVKGLLHYRNEFE